MSDTEMNGAATTTTAAAAATAEGVAGMPKGDADFLIACLKHAVGGGIVVSCTESYNFTFNTLDTIIHHLH